MSAALCTGNCQSSTTPCPALPCCSTYQCQIGAFSQCSTSCGSGQITRAATCMKTCDGQTIQVSTAECASALNAPCSGDSQPCNTATLQCQVGAFSQCSASCGSGVISRGASCVKTCGGTSFAVSPTECASNNIACAAGDTQPCNTATYQCQIGAFGQCSNSCGSGVMNRPASCMKTCGGVSFSVSASECASNSVVCNGDSQPCNTATYQCQIGSFSQCSTSCGQGVMTRPASCMKRCAGGSQVTVTTSECTSTGVACNGDSQPCTICPTVNQGYRRRYVNQGSPPVYNQVPATPTYHDANTFGRQRRLLEASPEAAATIADSVLSNALSLPAGAMLVVALFASSVLMVRRAVDAGFKREVELLEAGSN